MRIAVAIADPGAAQSTALRKTAVKATGADRAKVQKAADDAKAGCPISKLLNATITLDATIST